MVCAAAEASGNAAEASGNAVASGNALQRSHRTYTLLSMHAAAMSATAQFCDVRSTNVPTVFNENEFVLNILKTRRGAILWQATHISMMLTCRPRGKLNGDDRAPYYHFRKVSMRCPALNPHTRKLTDFIQVLFRDVRF